MPVDPSSMSAAIQASGPDLKGVVWPQFTLAVAIGVSAWIQNPANFQLSGVSLGTVGSGSVMGKFMVPPNPILLAASLNGAGMKGQSAAIIARAVAMGVASSLNASAAYQGVAVGVGTGTDVSVVGLSNAASLILSLNTAFAGVGYHGVNISSLSVGLGNGLASMLQAGTGTGIVTGVSGPIPATGTSLSRIM